MQLYSLCYYLDIIMYFLITYIGVQAIKWWRKNPWNVEDYDPARPRHRRRHLLRRRPLQLRPRPPPRRRRRACRAAPLPLPRLPCCSSSTSWSFKTAGAAGTNCNLGSVSVLWTNLRWPLRSIWLGYCMSTSEYKFNIRTWNLNSTPTIQN